MDKNELSAVRREVRRALAVPAAYLCALVTMLVLFSIPKIAAAQEPSKKTEQTVTVQQYQFEASVVCADGRMVDVSRVSLMVPQGDAQRFFSPPPSSPGPFSVDPYTIRWTIRNACAADPGALVRFNVRNIDEARFILTGESAGTEGVGPGFMTKIAGEVAEMPLLGNSATLRVRRSAGKRIVYPDVDTAIKAVRESRAVDN